MALGAAGGAPPYSWSIAGGALPKGLVLSPGGTATGTPTTAGAFSFLVRLDDAAGGTVVVSRTITVVPHLKVQGLCAKFCDVEQGCVTICGEFGLQGGGLGPYRYKVTAGLLPKGMGLNGLSLTGAFPAPAVCTVSNCGSGPVDFTVAVSDVFGATGKVHALFDLFPHITLATQDGPCFDSVPNGCTVQLGYAGGTPGGSVVVTTGNVVGTSGFPNTLPAGYTAVADGGLVTVTIPSGVLWFGTFALTLWDQSPCSPTDVCSSSPPVTVTIVGD